MNKPENEFCTMMRRELKKDNLCKCFDRDIVRLALKKKEMVTKYCYAGMMESIVPIFFRNIHLGYCMMGQYRGENKLNSEILRERKAEKGMPEKIVINYLKTPSFSVEQIANIQNLFQVMVDYIVSLNMITIKKNILLDKIFSYIDDNLDKNVSITDVAEYVCKSTSTVSHLFSSQVKKSFKQYIIELKLERAEETLLSEPDITVIEVADRLGYDDPYYFSRLFKKYKGVSPSAYVKKHYSTHYTKLN